MNLSVPAQTLVSRASTEAPISLAVVVLTHNEEIHIGRAVDGIVGLASEIYVIDSGSTDATTRIAESKGATVLVHPFVNYAQQFQWGLDHAPITADWVMRLDADEVIEPDLAARLRTTLPGLGSDIVGVNLSRKHYFLGRWIRYGGRYPLRLLRVWRRGHGRIEDRWMDEHMVVSGGRMIDLEGGFADRNENDVSFFINKHNKYATREALDRLLAEHGLSAGDTAVNEGGSSRQAQARRSGKEIVYNRLPFGVGPFAYFFWRYFVQLGFLDGVEGLAYHVLQGFWYRFLVEVRVHELRQQLKGLEDGEDIRRSLSKLTGFSV